MTALFTLAWVRPKTLHWDKWPARSATACADREPLFDIAQSTFQGHDLSGVVRGLNNAQFGSELGSKLAGFGPDSVEVSLQTWPMSRPLFANLGPILPNHGRNRPKLGETGRLRPMSGRNRAPHGRIGPKPATAEVAPNLTVVGQTSADLDRFRPDVGENQPASAFSAEFAGPSFPERSLSNSAQPALPSCARRSPPVCSWSFWAEFGRHRRNSEEAGQTLARVRLSLAQSQPSLANNGRSRTDGG